jgi:hypothetical protein
MAAARTQLVWPKKLVINLVVMTLHSLQDLSSLYESSMGLGELPAAEEEKQIPRTLALWALITLESPLTEGIHRRMVESLLQDAIRFPAAAAALVVTPDGL